MKINAAVARQNFQPLTIEELELDDIRPNEVRVRMVGSGICHTDAIVRDGVYPVPRQVVGRISSRSKLGMVGSARPRCTSRGRFQAIASWGRVSL